MLWLGDHLRSASHLDILLVGLGCLISIPECRRLAAGVVILTMTFEGLLLGLPKRPDGGPFTVQMRLAWQLRFGASVWAGSAFLFVPT